MMGKELNRRCFLGGMALAGVSTVVDSVSASDKLGSVEMTPNVAGSYDLVVAGGSATGVCAAVTAARRGLKVALVEYNAFFGGMATAGLVPVWHSLWSTDGKAKIIGGLTEEIETRLLRRGEARRKRPEDASVGCYFNVAAMQIVLDELIQEHPLITPFLKAQVVAVEKKSERQIAGVVIEDKSGRRVLRGKWFIDATGDADLVAHAGFETWTLPKGEIQGHTLCAIVANAEEIRKVHPSFSFDEMMKPRRGAGLNHVFQWQAPVIGAPGLTFLSATRIANCDPSVAAELTGGLMEARSQIRRLIDATNREFPMPEGKRLALVALGSDLGVRESRHVKAKYRVTEHDVLYGRHFDDCIGKGSYRVDIHEGSGIVFRSLDGFEDRMTVTPDGEINWARTSWRKDGAPRPTWYEIPMSALIPEKAANLVCAGRMIDCERAAYGALRVMVNCNQMGEAAANYAADRIS